ncbi:hypothetical protein niasHT_021343 [Heterodera trifolii]|uniref:Uncharacterized protein n=1 Tax=Heterodera trifolii TaxID=157864 RepID=A0ABD2K7D2_9BILA
MPLASKSVAFLPSFSSSLCSAFLLFQFVLPFCASADFDLSTKSGSKVCVGEICADSSPFHYYECCGQIYNECCLRLQTWLIAVLLVVAICAIASFLIGLIKCICCCNGNR